jgi:hypothetical protein
MRSLLAYHSSSWTVLLTTIVWFSIWLGTSMSPRNCLVTHGLRALSVCVSLSFSQNPSAPRTPRASAFCLSRHLTYSKRETRPGGLRYNFRSVIAEFEDRMTCGQPLRSCTWTRARKVSSGQRASVGRPVRARDGCRWGRSADGDCRRMRSSAHDRGK